MLFGAEGPAISGSPVVDDARRRIVNLVLLVYVLLIVEGALRKWLFPEFGQVLYFVRDPFVLGIYGMAIFSGYWPRSSVWMNGALLLALLSSVLAVAQISLGLGFPQSPLLFAAYGLRNYFFYIPLAFIVAAVFQAEDLRRMAVISWMLLAVSAVLVMVQFYSPIGSAINVGTSDNPLLQFRGLGLNELRTRPMGLFTSDTGQKQLVVSCLALLIAGWSGAFSLATYQRVLLPVATFGVLACLAFSGSRGAVLSAGLVVVAALFAVARGGSSVGRGRLLFVLGAVLLLAALLVPFVFADGFAAFLERWTSAQSFEQQQFSGGIFGRALYGFIDFFRLMTATPLIGFGIGMGGNAASTLSASAGAHGLSYYAETDWARHMVDLGPILGLMFMTFRIGLVIAVARRVLVSRNALAILLFGYLGYELLTGQITGQGTVNGYVWLFTGFTLAAAAQSVPAVSPQGAPRGLSASAVERFPNLMR